uniref:zinc-ribbon domain-containing protein n=1 Tax=Streptomyces antimycoticus TaxID=68175 RepID=UPI003B21B362
MCRWPTYPQVAATWLQERNGGMTPQKATPKMQVDAWWRCPAGYEYLPRLAGTP